MYVDSHRQNNSPKSGAPGMEDLSIGIVNRLATRKTRRFPRSGNRKASCKVVMVTKIIVIPPKKNISRE
jgi:hypothetical protein